MQNNNSIIVSVVIPAYNEARRLRLSLPQVAGFLAARPESAEVIVVDDGSTDATAELVQNMSADLPGLRLLRHPANGGKGSAVRTGMLSARGEYVLFTDADLSSPISELDRLLEPLRTGYDLVIGSRALQPEWITVHQSPFREASGRLFNFFARRIARMDFRDTQCGFKLFRREAARVLFAHQRIPGFGFDVELLYLARKFGYRALEVPVHWAHSDMTKVHPLRDGARMFVDLLAIRVYDWIGNYSRPLLASHGVVLQAPAQVHSCCSASRFPPPPSGPGIIPDHNA